VTALGAALVYFMIFNYAPGVAKTWP
jgi:hypothetical protein